ncbi:MAG TPA: glycosyltransferase [Mycobacteriales bacterium]|nr:glycosyltransferase [Mycobacteriales bacterium]
MTTLQSACLTLAIISFALFAHPYVTYPLSLALLARRHPRPLPARQARAQDGAGFAIFFSAHNERRAMPSKVANCSDLLARYPKLSIYAYDDASDDGTGDVLAASPGIRLTRGASRAGKAHGMKLMVADASEKLLVFTDANVELDLDCIDELAKIYADPDVGGICGSLAYRSSSDESTTERSGGLYWRLEERIKDLESRTGNVMGADGSIFSVRREMYPAFPDTVQDDFIVSMNVVFSGSRLVRAPNVIAYEDLVADPHDELTRKIRIATRAYHTHLTMQPRRKALRPLDRYKYISHKVLRWWGAVPLAASVASTAALLLTLGLAGYLLVGTASLSVISLRVLRVRYVLLAAELATAIAATTIGAVRALRGTTVAVWTPPASR